MILIVALLGAIWILCWVWQRGPWGRKAALGIVGLCLGAIFVEGYREQRITRRIEATRASVDKRLHSALATGVGSAQIEKSLNAAGLKWDYDDGLKSYYSEIVTEQSGTIIMIFISVDQERRLETIKVLTRYHP